MKDIVILLAHLLTTVAKLLGPGGAKAIIAENFLLKQQLLVVTRSRRRAPNLSTADRFHIGLIETPLHYQTLSQTECHRSIVGPLTRGEPKWTASEQAMHLPSPLRRHRNSSQR
jgi:hypothetical protein